MRFIFKQRFDALEQFDLLGDSISAHFGNIYEKQNTSFQMGQSSDRLHFNGISFFQTMVQNTWGIDNLPSNMFIIGMTYIQTLGGERIGLYIYIGVGDIVGETGFTYIRVPGY